MDTTQDHNSSSALELLQIRAITFHDTVADLLATMETDDPDPAVAEDNRTPVSAEDSVDILLADIANSERLHSPMAERPAWYGPIEQLSLEVAGSGELLLDYADKLLDEIQHHDDHEYGCGCYQSLDLLHERFSPAINEFGDLLAAIERLRRHRPSHPPTAGENELQAS